MPPKHGLTANTRTASGSLADAVAAALSTAPRHHTVVAIDAQIAGARCWRVEVVPYEVTAQYVIGLGAALAAVGATAAIDVWEQDEDVEEDARARDARRREEEILSRVRRGVQRDLHEILAASSRDPREVN